MKFDTSRLTRSPSFMEFDTSRIPKKQPVGRPVTKEPPVKPEWIDIDVGASDSIGDVCRRAVKIADSKKCPVRFTFKGMALEATEGMDEWDLANKWFRESRKVNAS